MSARSLLFGAACALAATTAALLVACATDEATAAPPDDEPSVDAAGDVLDGGEGEADAPPCSDCEYFPERCEADALCPSGPFEPGTVGGSFDVRTQVNIIRGRSKDDVWVAGALGTLAHFDGQTWTRSESGAIETIRALWLRSTGEVAFGRPESLYTRGLDAPDASASPGGWTRQEPAALPDDYANDMTAKIFESAWASPDAEWLWAATRRKFYSQSSTGLWRLRRQPSGSFEMAMGLPTDAFSKDIIGIHGISADVLFAVGPEGETLRVRGAQSASPTFERFNSQTWNALHGVWAASESEAWSVGAWGTIRRYRGDPAFWEIVSDVPTTENLNAVWGSSMSDVWAVGDHAMVLHYDGARWSRVKIAGLGARRPDLDTVWMPEPGHVWVGGHGVVLSLGGKP